MIYNIAVSLQIVSYRVLSIELFAEIDTQTPIYLIDFVTIIYLDFALTVLLILII